MKTSVQIDKQKTCIRGFYYFLYKRDLMIIYSFALNSSEKIQPLLLLVFLKYRTASEFFGSDCCYLSFAL